MQSKGGLLKLGKLGDTAVKVEIHKTLNSPRGIITEREREHQTEEEILENLCDQDVCSVRRIKARIDGRFFNTCSLIFRPNLPKTIKIVYLGANVQPYLPDHQRCFRCQNIRRHEILFQRQTNVISL